MGNSDSKIEYKEVKNININCYNKLIPLKPILCGYLYKSTNKKEFI